MGDVGGMPFCEKILPKVILDEYNHFFNFEVNLDPRDTVKFKIVKFSSLGTPGTPREPQEPPEPNECIYA